LNTQLIKTYAVAIYTLMRTEIYTETRGKIIYTLIKTVCNNKEIFVGLKCKANPCLHV